MLFNSYEFIFVFLPIMVIIYFILNKFRLIELSKYWLVLGSLFFYAWWEVSFLHLIIVSILVNYTLGRIIYKKKSKVFLILGILFNLGFLGYYKYIDFIINNINLVFNQNIQLFKLALPLAISFFTFQQIAFLVDSYKKETKEFSFLNYSLFVTFFPQLIAGPYEARISKALSDIKKIPHIYKESFKSRQILFDESYQGYMPRGYSHIKNKINLSKWNTEFHKGYSVYFKYMERFFDLSNRYNIKIYVYEFPWPEIYMNHKNLEVVRNYYTTKIKKIADKFSNVYYIENNNLFLPHKNFIDLLHLNNLGAELLSHQLSKNLNNRKESE